jgi:DNA primase
MDVSAGSGIARSQLHWLEAVTAAAAEIFCEPPRRAAAVTYLKRRGIDATLLGPEWVIGYAPPGWTRLLDRLRGAFSDQVLLDAGLARWCSRGTLIDTFRERVIFGMRNADGHIAGFIGRDLSGDPQAPKYINTRQHALFEKRRLLFGLDEGLCPSMAGEPVIVEGPVDVLAIAARQAAQRELGLLPLASSGTAFTPEHARCVTKLAVERKSPVVVAMDRDSAGRAAAIRLGDRLHRAGVDVRIATLPDGIDPADYLAAGGSTLDTFRADHAVPLLQLHVEDAIARQGDAMQWPEGRLGALREVAGHLSTYPPETAARQAGSLAATFGFSPSAVTFELADAFARASRQTGPQGRLQSGVPLGIQR